MKKPFRISILFLIATGLLGQGCISKGKHEDTLAELAASQEALASHEDTLAQAFERIAQIESEKLDTDARLATCERSIRNTIRETEEVGRLLNTCRSNLVDTSTRLSAAQNRHRSAESQSMKTREQLAEERAQLEQMNAERQTLVAELNKLQAEARERQRLYDEMTNRFQSLITAGQLDVTLVNGRLMINMPQDILFRSGSADIGRDGQAALTQVAAVLRDFRDRQFQVEGHSDNVPISTRTFPSNWELSAARALSVVHILQAGGVAPTSLSAAGYGEYHPVAPNDSKENRTKNRRIEIVILPNLEELAPAAK